LRKTLWTFLLLGATSAIKGLQFNQGGRMELTRLKMSLVYVRAIKTFRLLFMSLLGMGVCIVFLFMGLALFHASLFLYSPWSMQTKMIIGFLFSAVYLLMTLTLLYKIFAQDIWLKIFNAENILDQIKGEIGPAEEEGSEKMVH
jgi:hypothetical protein